MLEKKPWVVGITGLSGSGKTYLVDRLRQQLDDRICVLGFDDYYNPLSAQFIDENGEANYDLPSALNSKQFEEDLLKLIQGHPITIKKYQFEHYSAPEITEIITPKSLILVEGIFVLSLPTIDQWLDYRVFVEADTELCFERRLIRDTQQRNIPKERSEYQWTNHVIPAYQQFILPQKNRCDLILENNDQFDVQCQKLAELLINQSIEF